MKVQSCPDRVKDDSYVLAISHSSRWERNLKGGYKATTRTKTRKKMAEKEDDTDSTAIMTTAIFAPTTITAEKEDDTNNSSYLSLCIGMGRRHYRSTSRNNGIERSDLCMSLEEDDGRNLPAS